LRYPKQQRLNQGLEAYFQEQWPLALKHLKTKANPHAWTIDLLAASAAQHQGDLQERDMLIYEALSEKPSAKESIILFQAKLQIEKRQFEQAQASLEQIPLQSRFYSNLWQILQTHLDLHFGQYRKALERLMTYKKTLQSHHQYYDLYRQCLTHELNHALNHNQVIYAFELYKSSPLQLKINADIVKLVLTHLENQPKLFKHVYHYLKKQAIHLYRETHSSLVTRFQPPLL
jgi:HemY protein